MSAAKKKTVFFCKECGNESAKWMGQCPACHAWNSFTEQEVRPAARSDQHVRAGLETAKPTALSDIRLSDEDRVSTGMAELDRVLGGGVVPGSMILVGGDPGIGKSTLLLQACREMAAGGQKLIYISGEESLKQIRMRADRLGEFTGDIKLLCETDLGAISDILRSEKPDVVVIDSIQTMYRPEMASAPGSVSQVRECASMLMRLAKQSGCSVFLVGHVTKEGAIAGPRVLEHMVDAVLYFEGDRQHQYRLLRAVKNRFGSVNELGMFEMTDKGMREVENASEALLSERAHGASGSVVMCAMEGSRPLLTDVQALVSATVFGNPRRMASGVDQGRLALLLAVLEKRVGLRMYDQDVYINIAGGMSLTEPAADLALCAAVASSHRNRAIGPGWAVMGEVGLAGEVRAIGQAERRVAECARMGFDSVILPKFNLRKLRVPEGIKAVGVETVAEAVVALGLHGGQRQN